LRERSDVPVIMLSARDTEVDKALPVVGVVQVDQRGPGAGMARVPSVREG
jgi:hypothetical protein